jgi:hypothetical protein
MQKFDNFEPKKVAARLLAPYALIVDIGQKSIWFEIKNAFYGARGAILGVCAHQNGQKPHSRVLVHFLTSSLFLRHPKKHHFLTFFKIFLKNPEKSSSKRVSFRLYGTLLVEGLQHSCSYSQSNHWILTWNE